jgi:hypothetical protein
MGDLSLCKERAKPTAQKAGLKCASQPLHLGIVQSFKLRRSIIQTGTPILVAGSYFQVCWMATQLH